MVSDDVYVCQNVLVDLNELVFYNEGPVLVVGIVVATRPNWTMSLDDW